MTLQTRILAGVAAGIAIGVVARTVPTVATAVIWIEPAGTIFIRLITMIVLPLVIASLFVGIASLGDVRTLGRIGGRTLLYFLGTTTIAAVIGMAVALIAGAGRGLDPATRDAIASRFESAGVAATGGIPAVSGFAQTLVAIVPQNPFAAAAQGDLLAVIFAVVLFGAAATALEPARRQPLVSFFTAVPSQ